ncbi:MAG: hypothetical protein PHR35_18370 [Kiritimatiellae bacterium]|nr:hypothetical protein [Kiritimatiellia bacterium]
MTRILCVPPTLFALAALSLGLRAADAVRPGTPGRYTGTVQSSQLYSPPDPQAAGGIRGKLVAREGWVAGVFATPQDDWKKFYLGRLSPDGTFDFTGLPAGKYDLAVIGTDGLFEGLTLHRQDDTLTDEDRRSIQDKIKISSPFFNEKRIERCAGTTGHAGQARILLQELRSRPITLQSAEVRADLQVRSFKLGLLEDVGPAWALEETREFLRQEVGSADVKGLLPTKYCKELSGIRVVTEVKDVGEIVLRK